MKELKIKAFDEQGSFEKIMAKTAPEIQTVAREIRSLIAEVFPGVCEVAWERQRIAGYGVRPRKMSEHFCYIAPMKSHVNLGFYYGADLVDPSSMLEGTGKKLRHVKVHSKTEARNPALKKLLVQATKYLPRLK